MTFKHKLSVRLALLKDVLPVVPVVALLAACEQPSLVGPPIKTSINVSTIVTLPDSITLDPEYDTSPVLKKYAKIHHVGAGWLFLTGKPDDIELLRRKLGFTYTNPQRDKDKEKHIGNVRYGNEALQLWAACPGLAHAEWIAESISWVDWPKNRLAGRRSQPGYE